MSGDSHTTTDHDEIRQWVDERGGWPAQAKGTASAADEAGVLRIAFDADEASLERISWEAFFDKFDQEALAFLYQERTADGQPSRFFKLVRRD